MGNSLTIGMEDPDKLWDIHRIRQIYLTYAAAMDSHKWDLMDQCFYEDAEIVLGSLGRQVSTSSTIVDLETWKRICREIDVTFDAIQHYIHAPLIDIDGDIARVRVYYTAKHVKNALAPASFFTSGGWYNSILKGHQGEWRIKKQTAATLWYSGNPAVILGSLFPVGAQHPGPEHFASAWLTASSKD
jgi:3-phenylpropionate/cinnamic acid dioxygenase small subunit